jgi:hypothetical protein
VRLHPKDVSACRVDSFNSEVKQLCLIQSMELTAVTWSFLVDKHKNSGYCCLMNQLTVLFIRDLPRSQHDTRWQDVLCTSAAIIRQLLQAFARVT